MLNATATPNPVMVPLATDAQSNPQAQAAEPAASLTARKTAEATANAADTIYPADPPHPSAVSVAAITDQDAASSLAEQAASQQAADSIAGRAQPAGSSAPLSTSADARAVQAITSRGSRSNLEASSSAALRLSFDPMPKFVVT